MATYTHDDLLERALVLFPDLGHDIEACDGLPSLQVAAIAERLQRAKGAADWTTYERGIQLAAQCWDHADTQLHQELRWSFIKVLDFTGNRGPLAWAYLTPDMQRTWTRVQKQLADLGALPTKAKKRKP